MKRREFITLLGGAAAAWPLGGAGAAAGETPVDRAFFIGGATKFRCVCRRLRKRSRRDRLYRRPERRNRVPLGGGTI